MIKKKIQYYLDICCIWYRPMGFRSTPTGGERDVGQARTRQRANQGSRPFQDLAYFSAIGRDLVASD